jgi:predicted DNA binding CopG/RHH family protein
MEEIKDLPDYVLRTGTTRLSSEYYTIVNGLAEQGSADPWGEALAIFTRKNPGRLAYTIPRSENTGLIKINKTKEAADWVRENGAFIKEYGTTGVLFAPQIGEFDINAYSYLKSQGYTKNRDLDDFLMEMSTKKSRVEYDAIKQRWDERINSTSIDSVKSAYRAQSAEALRSFKNANPLLAQQLADFEFTTITQQTGVDELRRMLSNGDAPNPRLARQLQLMLKVYDSARSIWATGMGGEQLPPDRVREIRQDSIAQLERIAGNDPALQLAIDKLFAPVLERSRN